MFKKLNVKQIERYMMLGLVLIFFFWMARQCASSSNAEKMQPITTSQETPAPTTQNNNTTTTQNRPQAVQSTTRRDTIIQKEYVNRPTQLFVWVKDLKVRTEPYLTSTILATLAVNSQLSFQNETSTFKQKIRLDNIDYDERWLKVQTTDGKIGWVYGGGVRLYQK